MSENGPAYKPRPYGSGRIFLRGRIWWISYWFRGAFIRESSHSQERAIAEKMLNRRIEKRNSHKGKNAAERRLDAISAWIDRDLKKVLSQSVKFLIEQFQELNLPVAGVYFIQSGEFIKIGWASNIKRRIKELQVGNPQILTLLAVLPGPPAFEREIHEILAITHQRGEWFRYDDHTIDFLHALDCEHATEQFIKKEQELIAALPSPDSSRTQADETK